MKKERIKRRGKGRESRRDCPEQSEPQTERKIPCARFARVGETHTTSSLATKTHTHAHSTHTNIHTHIHTLTFTHTYKQQ